MRGVSGGLYRFESVRYEWDFSGLCLVRVKPSVLRLEIGGDREENTPLGKDVGSRVVGVGVEVEGSVSTLASCRDPTLCRGPSRVKGVQFWSVLVS